MAENSKIEWTDHTFNPWEGCQKVGPGCDHCYAETRNARFGGGIALNWGPGASRRRTLAGYWRKPLAWQAAAAAFFGEHGRRQRVFCASLADVFDNAVDPAWRADLWKLIWATPDLDWLLLTKRIGNVNDMLPDEWGDEPVGPWRNVWLGATIVDQAEADRDIPKLLAVPAAKRFLSMEPLLGSVDLDRIVLRRDGDCPTALSQQLGDYIAPLRGNFTDSATIDWVIVGGESGAGARPMHLDWVRSLRNQCEAADVPFLFKQWGSCLPGDFEGESETGGPAYNIDDAAQPVDYDDLGRGTWLLDQDAEFVRFTHKRCGRWLDTVTHDGYPGPC